MVAGRIDPWVDTIYYYDPTRTTMIFIYFYQIRPIKHVGRYTTGQNLPMYYGFTVHYDPSTPLRVGGPLSPTYEWAKIQT